MVRLAVVSWQNQAAPNSYTGSGPLGRCPVRRRQPCLRSRPRNLSVPNAVSSKWTGSIPSRGHRFHRTITWESRPTVSFDRREFSQGDSLVSGQPAEFGIVPVSLRLGVRATKSGDSSSCSLVAPVLGVGANPKQWGRAFDASGQRDHSGSESQSFAASRCVRPGCPRSANSSPRRAGGSEGGERAESSRSARLLRISNSCSHGCLLYRLKVRFKINKYRFVDSFFLLFCGAICVWLTRCRA